MVVVDKYFIFWLYFTSIYLVWCFDSNSNQCIPGKIYTGVTLKAGIKAGKYIEGNEVDNDYTCAQQCCNETQCDVAFMLGRKCFLVICSNLQNCSMVSTNYSPLNPRLIYVIRTNSEGVLHTLFSDDQKLPWKPNICPPMVTLKQVTLKGGLNSAEFTDIGPLDSLQQCYDICCQKDNCDLAFMLAYNCFTVSCSKIPNQTQSGCILETSVESGFNPEAAHILSRINPAFLSDNSYSNWKSLDTAVNHIITTSMPIFSLPINQSYAIKPQTFSPSLFNSNTFFNPFQTTINNPFISGFNQPNQFTSTGLQYPPYFGDTQSLVPQIPNDIMKGYIMIDANKFNNDNALTTLLPDFNANTLMKDINQDCNFGPILQNMTFKNGKKAGRFVKHTHSDGTITSCAESCCKLNNTSFKCQIALLISGSCYFVHCHNATSCSMSDSKTSFSPKIVFVRKPVNDIIDNIVAPIENTTLSTTPLPPILPSQNVTLEKEANKIEAVEVNDTKTEISEETILTNCRHEQVFVNMTVEGASNSDAESHQNIRPSKRTVKILSNDVSNMAYCTQLCCQHPKCDAAVLQDGKCMAVSCSDDPRACVPVSMKSTSSDSQLAFMSRIDQPLMLQNMNQKYFFIGGIVVGSVVVIAFIIVGTVTGIRKLKSDKPLYLRRKPIRNHKYLNRTGEKTKSEEEEEHDKLEELLSRVSASFSKNKSNR